MKIYISLPITGQEMETVETRCMLAKGYITGRGHAPVSPLDLQPDPAAPYPKLMANCIEALMQCDAACFLKGWECSKGCRLEWHAADIYGIERYYDLEHIPRNKPSND